MFYLASYQNKKVVYSKFESQTALNAFFERCASLMEGAYQTDLASILAEVEPVLEAKRAFHAECNSRTMFHWVWEYKGTTYVWHRDTGYDVCSQADHYAYASKWFVE